MHSQIKLGKISGIEIGLHYSWLIIGLLITMSLITHFHITNPLWSWATVWVLAVMTAILFFASIIVHELSHSLVAKARGIPVHSITLFALGGIAQISQDSRDPKTEFWMAVAGPVTSVFIGIAALWSSSLMGWGMKSAPGTPLMAMLVWLGYINISLGVFNMIPGFPLDGGRVFRSLVWWMTKDYRKATKIAAKLGQFVALLFMIAGIARFFSGGGLAGLWIVFIGLFLLDAAGTSALQVETLASLQGVRVKDVMSRDCSAVESGLDLQSFVDDYLLRKSARCFIVEENQLPLGMITAGEVKKVNKNDWGMTPVRAAMIPLSKIRKVNLETPIVEVLEIMGNEDLNQLPVVSNSHVEGMISRGQVLQFLQTKSELKV